MDIAVELIQSLGFPIAVAVASFYFIWDKDRKLTEDNRDRENRLVENAKHREDILNENMREMRRVLDSSVKAITAGNNTNKELSETNKKLVDELSISLSNMEREMCKISTILEKK